MILPRAHRWMGPPALRSRLDHRSGLALDPANAALQFAPAGLSHAVRREELLLVPCDRVLRPLVLSSSATCLKHVVLGKSESTQ
jgi:hypothetical protein